jgi:hypothetical protein
MNDETKLRAIIEKYDVPVKWAGDGAAVFNEKKLDASLHAIVSALDNVCRRGGWSQDVKNPFRVEKSRKRAKQNGRADV